MNKKCPVCGITYDPMKENFVWCNECNRSYELRFNRNQRQFIIWWLSVESDTEIVKSLRGMLEVTNREIEKWSE